MKPRWVVPVALLLLLASSHATAGTKRPSFKADHSRYLEGELVTITLTNKTKKNVNLEGDWIVSRTKTDEAQANYVWPAEEQIVAPGQTRTWEWDQYTRCYGGCQNVHEGFPVGPGVYEVTAPTSAGELHATFRIGVYFTLGFGESEDEFAVFVQDPATIDDFRAQAAATEKTKHATGIVAGRRSYNPDWSYTLRPASIALAEVSIEVCDGNPNYVEENRKDWMGEQWCPWSSYVKREGL